MGTALKKQARITSKGQVTIPRDIRRALGVKPGDQIVFEKDDSGVRVRPIRVQSGFAKYQGIGNFGVRSGRKAILRRIREMRDS